MPRRRVRRRQPTTDQRTPEQRLDALVREPGAERAHRIFARILDDLDADPRPGPWIAAARTLSERLIISEDTFYYFVEKFNECLILAASDTDPELMRIRDAMTEIEDARGLREDETWLVNEAPEDWRVLNDEWDRRADAIINDALRELGHSDVATLREGDFAEYERRTTKGQADLWGEDEEV
jgi:hypothetical protein